MITSTVGVPVKLMIDKKDIYGNCGVDAHLDTERGGVDPFIEAVRRKDAHKYALKAKFDFVLLVEDFAPMVLHDFKYTSIYLAGVKSLTRGKL